MHDDQVTHRPSFIPHGGRSLSPEELKSLYADMEAIVRGSHLFKSLDDAAREDLLSYAFVQHFDAGEVILREGDLGDTMILLMEGTVRVHTHSALAEIQLADLGRGACVGEVSVLTGSPRTATVDAVTDVTCAVLARHRVERILDGHPRVRELLEALVEGRARNTIERILGGE